MNTTESIETTATAITNESDTNATTNSGGFFNILPTSENTNNAEPIFLTELQNNQSAGNITSAFVRAVIGFIFFFINTTKFTIG